MPGFTNIIEVNLLEASKFHINVFDKIHQWDTGIKLHFSGIVLPAGTVCQFDTKTTSYNVALNLTDMTCDVPNLAIGEDLKGDLTCHLKVSTEDYGIVVFDIVIPTIRRQKPSNYIYSDNIQHIDEWISGQVAQFQQENKYFVITEDIVTVEQDSVYGVAPYNTSYYHTNITINENAGIRWVEGGLYQFVVDTSMVVDSQHRNVRVRIGSSGDWKPVMNASGTVLAGVSYFLKNQFRIFCYKSTYQNNGAIHLESDDNTTYNKLENILSANSLTVDSNGYVAQQSFIFATTPLTNPTGERYSSLVTSSSTGTTKAIVTPTSGKFYIDRIPYFWNGQSFISGSILSSQNAQQYYYNMDLRYSVNTNNTYLTAARKCFLWLKDFDESDMSFKADATVGNIMTVDKLATRFPSSSYATPLYLYYLGYTAAWNGLIPNIIQDIKIYKYHPSTGYLEPFFPGQKHLYEHELAFTLNDTLSHIYFSIAVKIITEESETILSGSTVKAKLASIYQCKTLQDFFSKYSGSTYKLSVYWSYVDSTQISGQNNKPAICTGMTVSNSGDVVFSYVTIISISSAAPISKWTRNLTDSEILVTNLNETITQLL